MVDRLTVPVFLACDKVIEEAGSRKKSVIGVFQTFSFSSLPSRFGAPWFIFAQVFGLDDGNKDVTINIVHDSTMGVVFAAGIELPENRSSDVDLVIEPTPTVFQKEGAHLVTLNIDGMQRASFSLSVKLVRQRAEEM